MLRSLLFIPADSDKKLGKITSTAADAFLIDLEDSVALPRKEEGRALTGEYLRAHPIEQRSGQLWVRVNPLDSGMILEDLKAVLPGRPDGVMLPKAESPADVQVLSHYLDALEAVYGLEQNSVKILPVATETAASLFTIGDYRTVSLPRLTGLTWGAEDLSTSLHASSNLDADGRWSLTYRMARSQTLLAAHAAQVQAIDTLFVNFRDDAGLAESSRQSRAEGFSGRLAIHPAQVDIINAAYMPTAEEVSLAQAIVAAFDADPNLGTVGIDGKMFDRPHFVQAQRTLALHHQFSAS